MELKKNEKHNAERKRPLFFLIGLNVALILSILAFDIKAPDEPIRVSKEDTDYPFDVLIDPIVTEIAPPAPPRDQIQKPSLSPNFKAADIELENLDSTFLIPGPPIDIPTIPTDPEDIKDEEPDVYLVPEEEPRFPGGFDALYQYISKEIRYPATSQRMGHEGRVFVKFIIERDGSIGNLEVIKGDFQLLNKEALRVLGSLPTKFLPGKQNGKPVRVQMVMPIHFKIR